VRKLEVKSEVYDLLEKGAKEKQMTVSEYIEALIEKHGLRSISQLKSYLPNDC
jgi:predicted CopG family antitoxin